MSFGIPLESAPAADRLVASCVKRQMRYLGALVALLVTSTAGTALAQYTKQAGKSAPTAEAAAAADPAPAAGDRDKPNRQSSSRTQTQPAQIARDDFGNARGSNFDLAVDGAFDGQTILVIDYYGAEYNQDFTGPRDAVKAKGFSVVRLPKEPSPEELAKLLTKSNQFWLISSCDNKVHLTAEHHKVIKAFFDEGRGVYLWGDNDPCNADADRLASILVDARVKGDLPGDTTVAISTAPGKPGIVRDHLLSTGVENVYEGVTVATVTPAGSAMTPVIYGSAGNLVTAAYESHGKRLLIDGGFTRLTYKWDTAGTGRYIRNAAAWLANYEKFGDKVLSTQLQKKKPNDKAPAAKIADDSSWW